MAAQPARPQDDPTRKPAGQTLNWDNEGPLAERIADGWAHVEMNEVFMEGFGARYRTTRAFAAKRGWSFNVSGKGEDGLVEQLRGEPFHMAERSRDAFPYPVLGRLRHRLSDVMRGAYRGRSATVFVYTREQEILDDSFGRRGRENSRYWVAALLDLPTPLPRLQVTPRTPASPTLPTIAVGDAYVDERFYVHSDQPSWAAGVLRDITSLILSQPAWSWRISRVSAITWTRATPMGGFPLDQVDTALDRLTAIVGGLTPPR
ncbi:hypothetical protein ABT299_05650 [Spirillospora sp. NPDC000708]